MEKDQSTLVLVADDEPSTLALVASHVRSKGFQVIEASDGDQAWQLAYENLPDLIILDVMMPGMSGWEVCRKVREAVSLAHTGVIMLTGIGENLNEMTSPLYGADTYIDKPFQFYDLDAKIDETLKKRRESSDLDDDAAADDDVEDDDDAPPDSGTVPSNSGWAQRNGAAKADTVEKPTLKVPSNPGPRKVAAPKAKKKAKPKAKKKAAKKAAKKVTKAKAKKPAKAVKKAKAKKAASPKKKSAARKAAKKKGTAKKAAATKKKRAAKKAAKAPRAKKKPARKK